MLTPGPSDRWSDAAHPRHAPSDRAGALLHTEEPRQVGQSPSMLDGLDRDQIAEVMRRANRRVAHKGATIFAQGMPHDGIYLIESGRVRVFYTSPAGREVTLAYWHPGNFVGGPEVFGRSPHVWSGVAAADTVVLHLRPETLRALIVEMPQLAIGVIESLSFKGKCYSAMAQMLGTRSVLERLAHLILHLADLHGVERDSSIVIEVPFTHAELAHLVGGTRQWIAIGLRRLIEMGVLSRRDSLLVVHDRVQLQSVRDER